MSWNDVAEVQVGNTARRFVLSLLQEVIIVIFAWHNINNVPILGLTQKRSTWQQQLVTKCIEYNNINRIWEILNLTNFPFTKQVTNLCAGARHIPIIKNLLTFKICVLQPEKNDNIFQYYQISVVLMSACCLWNLGVVVFQRDFKYHNSNIYKSVSPPNDWVS